MKNLCRILVNVYLWGTYPDIYATYKVAPTYHVARITVHKWQQTTKIAQDDDDDTDNTIGSCTCADLAKACDNYK